MPVFGLHRAEAIQSEGVTQDNPQSMCRDGIFPYGIRHSRRRDGIFPYGIRHSRRRNGIFPYGIRHSRRWNGIPPLGVWHSADKPAPLGDRSPCAGSGPCAPTELVGRWLSVWDLPEHGSEQLRVAFAQTGIAVIALAVTAARLLREPDCRVQHAAIANLGCLV